MRAPVFAWLDAFAIAQRTQLPLWFVACFGAGIACWFALAGPTAWIGAALSAAALGCAGITGFARPLGRALTFGSAAFVAGIGLVWLRSDWVAAPRLDRPIVTEVLGQVMTAEARAARDDVRLTLGTDGTTLPPIVRVTVKADRWTPDMGEGARIRVRARLQPPPPMALPGTHDFARDLWFQGIGAVGRALDPPTVVEAAQGRGLDRFRRTLGAHIRERLPGGAGGIATALANGDQSAVGTSDADAMRRSGLAHLLSVSGLHIAAAVGAAMLITRRVLALNRRVATHGNVIVIAAAVGAIAGIGYTLLTGMQVPTVRSCIAALLVLAAIVMGREAISMRLIATGALAVMVVRPESIAGASFQLSFAAVTAIVLLHQARFARRFLQKREESMLARSLRGLAALVATGLAVELALMPFALFHFHKAGLYGVAANLVAIPLTTFVIMPMEALALTFDLAGVGRPFWTVTGWAIDFLLQMAHRVGDAKGAVATLPSMPGWAFGAMVGGGLWMALWSGRVRWAGMVPVVAGGLAALTQPVPDLFVTGDGRHVAIVQQDGRPALLRSRSGDFVRDLMTESAGFDEESENIDELRSARCSRDACVVDVRKGAKAWRVLAIRSRDRIAWHELTSACAGADIVIADRRLPAGCTPRWMKLDRAALAASGGLSIALSNQPVVRTVRDSVGDHPWAPAMPMGQ